MSKQVLKGRGFGVYNPESRSNSKSFMIPLRFLKVDDSFVIRPATLEKSLVKLLIGKGLIPHKKLKIYFKSLGGGVVVGDDCLKIALCSSIAKKLVVFA